MVHNPSNHRRGVILPLALCEPGCSWCFIGLSVFVFEALSCPGGAHRAECGLESLRYYLFMCLHADVESRWGSLAAQRALPLMRKLKPFSSPRDRLRSKFALQWEVILILSWVGTVLYPPECSTCTRWCLSHRCTQSGGETEVSCLCRTSVCSHLSVQRSQGSIWRAPSAKYSRSMELHLYLVSSSFVWLCSSCAPLRKPQREKGKGRGERESCNSSHPCQALWLSSSGSLLCLFSFPHCLKLQLSGADRYHWGGSACDMLIVRSAIT